MKKINTLFILSAILSFLFVCSIASFAQVCRGDIVLSSQAEVDAFDCTEVVGNLTISGSDISNLDSLSILQSCGSLRIENNPELRDINGLSNLITVRQGVSMTNGGLSIKNNDRLKEINVLSNLQVVGSFFDYALEISENDSLINLDGFVSLSDVNGTIIIDHNLSLKTIDGFPSIREHHGDIFIWDNENLESISGFSELISLFSRRNIFDIQSLSFNIVNNRSLVHIEGFSSLTTLDGERGGAFLTIHGNRSLKDFNGLSSLSALKAGSRQFSGIRITENISLENINGLSGLRHSTDSSQIEIFVTNNPMLNDCCGLTQYISSGGGNITFENNGAGCPQTGGPCSPPKCTGPVTLSSQADIDAFSCAEVGSLTISGSDIVNLKNLSGLRRVNINLTIQNNPNLKTLDGLLALDSIGGGLYIKNNPTLSDIEGLSSLKHLGGDLVIDSSGLMDIKNSFPALTKINGLLSIRNNCNLLDISGFPSVTAIFAVSIYNNANLDQISGFKNLGIAGLVSVENNSRLVRINGFNSLETIREPFGGGLLVIRENEMLTNLEGFSSLSNVTDITIAGNQRLTNLNGLSSLESIWRSILLSDNPQLLDLSAFAAIDSIPGSLSIINNDKLINLNAFSSLKGIGLGLRIDENNSLTNLDGLSNVREVLTVFPPSSAPLISVRQNPSLNRCCGLRPLLERIDQLYGIENADRITIGGNGGGCSLQDILSCGQQTITKLTVIDKRTGQVVNTFENDSVTLDLAHPDFPYWMLVAHTIPHEVGSVVFTVANQIPHTENLVPYDFDLVTLAPGIHSVVVDVYTESNGGGEKGLGKSVTINVINSASIISFEIVNTSGQAIGSLTEGKRINIKDPAFKSFSIRAKTNPNVVSSVKFWLNNQFFRVENVAPYAFNGDINGVYNPWIANPWDYTIWAIPYIRVGGKEYEGKALEVHFKVVSENLIAVVSYDIVNTSGTVVRHLNEGDVIDVNDPVCNESTIVANTTGQIGSVTFDLNNQFFNIQNAFPYTLTGDNYGTYFKPWMPQAGAYTLTATPYSKTNANGYTGKSLSIHFSVVDNNSKTGAYRLSNTDLEKDTEAEIADVVVYPVPVGNALFVEFKDEIDNEAELSIHTVQGLSVFKGVYLKSSGINTHDLKPGVYYLEVVSGNGLRRTAKFVKK